MSFKLDYNNSELADGVRKAPDKLKVALTMYMSTKANELQSYMKINRPWTDRTGMAKATLNTSVSQPDENHIRMTLAHGVDYGIWLELANEKNYAIIGPTIDIKGPEVANGLANIMGSIHI